MESTLALVANSGDGTITTFRFTPNPDDPHLEHLATSPVGPGCSTFAIDAHHNLVYASTKANEGSGETAGIGVLRLDRDTGTLSRIGQHPTDGALVYLALAHDNRLLVGCSYHQGYGAVFPVDGRGAVGEQTARVEWPNAHCVSVAAGGRDLYLVSLGADVVAQYHLDVDGALTALNRPTLEAPSGSGPRHLVLDASEQVAYVVTEFGGEVLVCNRNPETGELTLRGRQRAHAPDRGLSHSRYGADPVEDHLIWGADLHLAREGAFVLASERCESTLAALPVGSGGGLGTMVSLVETQKQPRGFAVSPDGGFALVAGEKSSAVSLVAVGEDGSLQPVLERETGQGANWVRFVG